jgi:Bax protein
MIQPEPPASSVSRPNPSRALLRAGIGLLSLEAAFGALILLAAHPDIPVRPVVRIALTRAAPPPRDVAMQAPRRPLTREPIMRKPPLVLVSLPRPGLADGRRIPVLLRADRLMRDRQAGVEMAEGYGFRADEDQSLPGDPAPALATVAALSQLFAALDYKLTRSSEVPSLFLDRLPVDLAEEPESRRRKAVFLGTLLPLIVKANEHNFARRAEIARIDAALAAGPANPDTARRAESLLAEFRLDSWSKAELLRRADIVPPSLALAQAATESGWGRSSFARDGNALFGQREFVETEQSEGRLVPRLRRFDDLAAAVEAYLRNLNTHRAYAEFRSARAALRAAGTAPSGPLLVGYLTRYSEQGPVYTQLIQSLMRSNDLAAFDRSRLRRASVEISDEPAASLAPRIN